MKGVKPQTLATGWDALPAADWYLLPYEDYEKARERRAVVGAEYVYFPDNGDDTDPWCALEVRIVEWVKPLVFICECIQPELIPAGSDVPRLRTVKYSELW